MISQQKHLLLCCHVALILAVVQLANGAPNSASEDQAASAPAPVPLPVPSVRATFEPAKLFDFENYKRLFKKTYSGFLEELARKKYFLSRAFRAFVSAIKYKYRRASYYLAINWLSDASPKELDKMHNKVIGDFFAPRRSHRAAHEPTEHALDLTEMSGDFEDPLSQLAADSPPDGPGFDELERVMGAAGQASPGNATSPPRDLPFERLIDTGDDAQLDRETASKVKLEVESNNPDREPSEMHKVGPKKEQKEVRFWELNAPSSLVEHVGPIGEKPSSSSSSLWSSNGAEQKPDEVFLDLRDTKCFFLPRQQGSCGACYAFAMTAIIEWLYCMKTGNLVAFSEQYMIDCGKTYIEGFRGCDGGNVYGVADFVHNFGLELRTNYPYQMEEDECPYEPDIETKKAGYIRFEFEDALQVHVDYIGGVLDKGPMLIGISGGPGFFEYGGGVHGFGCDQERPSHAMVLIGHGREDGLEYWLVRNSYSVGWGDNGYYKMAKAANCIQPNFGYLYATRDGLNVEPQIKLNEHNDNSIVRRRYAATMLQ